MIINHQKLWYISYFHTNPYKYLNEVILPTPEENTPARHMTPAWFSDNPTFFNNQRLTHQPGWWYTYPPEKYESQIGSSSQLLGKIKFMFQTTNHQPIPRLVQKRPPPGPRCRPPRRNGRHSNRLSVAWRHRLGGLEVLGEVTNSHGFTIWLWLT
jgi:hypothetical protein